ncbi:MAG: hypothetical protein LBM12_00945 [Candidatus Nomurabacteria bacterium]|jgi:transcriptional regulator with XRE-family HTH domain|nr:hypothetical protein [Candidatus Nomurabacteria bacterium]
MNYRTKLHKILAFSGWSQDRLADLLEVSNGTMSLWLRGKKPRPAVAQVIDELYNEFVVPFIPTLEKRADEIEAVFLARRITKLPTEQNHK